MPRRIGLALVAAIAAALPLAVAAPAAAGPYVRLSDERTRTLSAFVDLSGPVKARPRSGSRRLGWLATHTFHGQPEVVLVLGERMVSGRRWLRIRYAGLGRRVGWVRQRMLSVTRLHRTLVVVDRGDLQLRLLKNGKVVMRVPVGVGASASPTPGGSFYIRERLALPNSNTIYGALAFGTSAFSRFRTDWPGGGQVGVHGTNQPGLIPGYISNGCVRMFNSDVLALERRIKVGTPLLIK